MGDVFTYHKMNDLSWHSPLNMLCEKWHECALVLNNLALINNYLALGVKGALLGDLIFERILV